MATSRYTKVAALIIRWTEELDLQAEGHTNEIDKLIKAFERFKFADFHCKVVRLTNKRKPQGQLERAISEHIDDHDGSRSLLIVYYTGHGMGLAEDKLGLAALGLMTTATELHDPIARWDDAERPLIKTADADVLTILDCCYSSNAVKAVTNDPRVYELLAACPFNEKTWGPSPTSLTTALTTALNHLLDKHGQEGFAVRALIQHILMIRMKPVAMYWDRLGTYQRSIILAPGPDFSKPIHDSQLELKDVTVSEREGSRDAKGGQKTKTNEPQADVQASSAEPRQDDVYDMKGEDLHEASQLSEEHLNPAASSSEGGHEYSEAHEQAHDPEADDSRHDRDRGGIATTETRETKTSGSLGANFDSPLPGLDDGDLQRRSWFQDKVDTVIGKANGYLHVAVLMIRWDESIDDFVRHTEEIDRLRTIFRDQFNYDCSVVNITTLPKPQLQFNRAISDFILNHDGPDNLLIIYYTGHGFTVDSEVERTRLVLCANQQSVRARERALEVRWDTAEAPLLHDTESDVITILDCSFASTAAIKAVEKSIRAYQLLAASAIDSPARGPGLQSFSTSLANSLEELVHESKKEGFPLIKLLETINVKNGMRESPAMLWDRLRTFRPFIHLAPMPKERRSKNGITLRTGEPETGALILRFSLKNTTDGLTLKQIEALARQLPKACIDANLPLRRIEWLGYIGRENLRVEKFRDAVRTTMLARAVCRKWRSYVEARRQQRDKTRAQIENAPEPTDSKRKRSETLQSPLPPSKQALYEERKRSETLQSLLHPSKQARYEVEPGSPQRMPSPSDSEDAYGGLMPDRKN